MRINQLGSEEGGYPGENDDGRAHGSGLYEMAVSLNSDLMDKEIVAIQNNGNAKTRNMLNNLDSNGNNVTKQASLNAAIRTKNQIIEPKDPINGQIEMQSGHQEINSEARNNE